MRGRECEGEKVSERARERERAQGTRARERVRVGEIERERERASESERARERENERTREKDLIINVDHFARSVLPLRALRLRLRRVFPLAGLFPVVLPPRNTPYLSNQRQGVAAHPPGAGLTSASLAHQDGSRGRTFDAGYTPGTRDSGGLGAARLKILNAELRASSPKAQRSPSRFLAITC